MKTLREHPCFEEISCKRGAQGKEMRSSNRPTTYLSSTELLGVLDSAEAPKCPVRLFRDTFQALQHNVAQKTFPCVNNYSEAYTVAAPCERWTHSKKDALLAISLIHSSYTIRRNTKSEQMCSEF